jgi:hypothetical protein
MDNKMHSPHRKNIGVNKNAMFSIFCIITSRTTTTQHNKRRMLKFILTYSLLSSNSLHFQVPNSP